MDSQSFDDLNRLNLKFSKRIEILEKENSRFKFTMDFLQTLQNQRDLFCEKLVDMDRDFRKLELSKKESDDRVRFLERELEDFKNSRVNVCAVEDSVLINDFRPR